MTKSTTISSKPAARQSSDDGLAPPQATGRPSRAEHILDTTATLLLRWGFRKTTIDDVAREAGVAKGTIYLHYKSKHELFIAAIMRAQQQAGEDVVRRINADAEGGLLHRLWTHGMMAALANPLLAAILSGKTDVVSELRGAFDPATIHQVSGDYEEYIVQLQRSGLIRDDLPAQVISFVTSAVKIGLITTPDLMGSEPTPPTEQVIEAMGDMIRRWLEPKGPSSDAAIGAHLATEFVGKIKVAEGQLV